MMKNRYFLLLLPIIVILSSCSVGRTTNTRAQENQGYLQFIRGNAEKYDDGVDVYVDDAAPFKAKVIKEKATNVKGSVYIIDSGSRHLKVVYKGVVLYEKDIILGVQETRTVRLP